MSHACLFVRPLLLLLAHVYSPPTILPNKTAHEKLGRSKSREIETEIAGLGNHLFLNSD